MSKQIETREKIHQVPKQMLQMRKVRKCLKKWKLNFANNNFFFFFFLSKFILNFIQININDLHKYLLTESEHIFGNVLCNLYTCVSI